VQLLLDGFRPAARSLLLLALALCTQPALGLTDEEIFRNFRFNLINPGARSLALGGAFISLADDATAAQANPAGLSFLRTSEYFIEVRAVDNAAVSTNLSEGIPPEINAVVVTGTDVDDTVSPTFFAGVLNLGSWKVAMSRQELLNIKNSTLSSFAFTFSDPPGAFLNAGTGSIDVEVVNLNYSAAYRVSNHFGIGGTLTVSGLDVKSEVVNQVIDTGGVLSGMEILEPTLDLRTTIDDSDVDVVFSLGLIYKHPGKWSLGGVFRQGPDFSVVQNIDSAGLDLFDVRGRLGNSFDNRFHLPDVFGVGGDWLPTDKLTLALNVERVLYSNLLDGFVPGVNILTSEDAEFAADDGTDYRFGAEYFLVERKRPLALRAGVSLISDGTIRATSTGSQSLVSEDAFMGQDSVFHGSIGLGLNVKRYRIDLAADFSETDNEYVVSLIYQGN
jgi:long-subunit fatty acid transport protein